MPKRVGLNLGETLSRLFGEAWDTMKRELARDPTAFFPLSPYDVIFLTSNITTIFYNSFHAYYVDGCRTADRFESRQTPICDEVAQSNLGLPEELRGRYAVS